LKILLITDVPPSKAFSGALFTDRLCNFLGKDTLAAYIVVNPVLKDTPVSPDSAWIPMEYCTKPNESGIFTAFRKYGFFFIILSQLLTFLKETYVSLFRIPRIVSRIAIFGKKHKVDRVWCILQGQTMIRIALKSAKKIGVPLYTQVWDPPQWWLKENSIDRITTNKILKLYAKTLKESRKMAAASINMTKIYMEKYEANTVPVIPSLNPAAIITPVIENNKEHIIIALAGQIYALDAWNSLLEAMDSVDWNIKGKKVKIRIMSYYLPNISGHSARNIEFLGYRGQNESIRLLSESDILYLPYWFDVNYDDVVRLSFPSKLTSYLAAGKPVLCHAPDYSSPADFISENNAGFVCSSMDKSEILKSIDLIDNSHDLVKDYTENGRIALKKILSDENLKQRFAEFLEIDIDKLRNE
jgi:glycosyltransferase involved in cell wall biosynthesis